MGSIQQLLVLGGIFILSFLSLTFFRSSDVQTGTMIENESLIAATGAGQALIDEIAMKAFDETTVSNFVILSNGLTLPASLGKDAGEINFSQFDDIDDYRGYSRIDSLRGGKYTTTISVNYASLTNYNLVAWQTFLKRIDASVVFFNYSKKSLDTLRLFNYISY